MPKNQNTYQQQMPPQMGQGGIMPPSQMRQPTGRRQRWNKRLMSGVASKITSLPNWFATTAVATYIVALLGVNLIYSGHAMEWYFCLYR